MPADPASTIKLAISATRRNSQRVQALLGRLQSSMRPSVAKRS
jgi:hypothetical protein